MSTVVRHSRTSIRTGRVVSPSPGSHTPVLAAATLFIDSYLDALRTLRPRDAGRWTCFGYGRGGVAYTLLKAGILRGDRALVRSAMEWAAAGIRSVRPPYLRYVNKTSFSLGLPGLHAVHALAAQAAGDAALCRRELRRFVEITRRGP
jgi:hypothetical protein